jgi:uncharacterized protein (DUF58 family)
VLYLFAGIFIIGRWWSGRALKTIQFQRQHASRSFPGEEIPVQVTITNRTWLPVPWLRVADSLPVELASPGTFKRAISLGPHEQKQFDYLLHTHKRGYYTIGPLTAASGDIFGLSNEQRLDGNLNHLVVYPRVYQLPRLTLVSRSPMGTLRHHQPIFEDPSRILGKRDYVVGDSLRRVDWKASAAAGKMQVKVLEPAIALETAIFLNLNTSEYDLRHRHDSTETAIVIAASVANRVISQKQAVGLNTNGLDPLADGERFRPLPPRAGQAQLMNLLDVLARVEAAESRLFIQMIHQETVDLPWGTTVVLITGSADEGLFDQLFQLRRAGKQVTLFLAGQVFNPRHVRELAGQFRIPFYHFRTELELETWQQ